MAAAHFYHFSDFFYIFNSGLKIVELILSLTQIKCVQCVRCSSMVRAFAHGAMDCQIDHHGGPISSNSQCSMTGVRKAVVCAVLSGMVHIKEPILLMGKSVVPAGFFSCYLNGLLPYF